MSYYAFYLHSLSKLPIFNFLTLSDHTCHLDPVPDVAHCETCSTIGNQSGIFFQLLSIIRGASLKVFVRTSRLIDCSM